MLLRLQWYVGAAYDYELNLTFVHTEKQVHVDNAEHVTIEGGGTIYGNAEHAWSYFSAKDDRFSPYGDDGSKGRPNVLLITKSRDIVLRDLHLHNSTDWTLRMEQSRDIFADNLDIYGDSRFPNNDGFDPVSCENVTLINSRIEVADDGICPVRSCFDVFTHSHHEKLTFKKHNYRKLLLEWDH